MLIKWITCDVSASRRVKFSEAQGAWKVISDARGFVCQFGGFNSNRAHILSLLKNPEDYASFMSSSHDDVVGKNQQHRFYNSIRVNLFSEVLRMRGANVGSIADALSMQRIYLSQTVWFKSLSNLILLRCRKMCGTPVWSRAECRQDRLRNTRLIPTDFLSRHSGAAKKCIANMCGTRFQGYTSGLSHEMI